MSGAGPDPLKELKSVQQRMNRLFDTALARTDFEAAEGVDHWTPVCDLYETRETLEVCLELPGLEQDQIEVRLEGDELVVSGERKIDRDQRDEQFHRVERSYGKFSRRLRLPSTVDRKTVEASYRDGLLRITLPNRGGGPARPIHVDIA